MKERRETLLVTTAAILFGVVFGILVLACGQSEDEPDARADAPTSANAKPDSPPAPSGSKAATAGHRISFNDLHTHVYDLGEQIKGLQGKATGDLGVALGELEAEQAQLMLELETIGGENDKWDAERTEVIRKAYDLRGRVQEFRRRVNE